VNAYTLDMRSVVLAAALLLSLSIGTLAAPRFHFELVKSSPTAGQKLDAAPARVQMWFSQPPAAGVSTITLKHGETDVELKKPVIDPKAKSITVEPLKPLAAGDYVAKWRGAGDDGHVSTGEVKFTVVAK
jgi:methionine-rich copper-binding protein CopC